MSNYKKVYIAAPFFNEFQLMVVQRIEQTLHNLDLMYHSPRTVGVIKSMTAEEKKANSKDIYNDNIEKMEICNAAVVFTDDKDTGTLFELGYMARMKKFDPQRKIITLSVEGKAANLMLAYGIDTHCEGWADLEEALTALKKEDALPENTAEISE